MATHHDPARRTYGRRHTRERDGKRDAEQGEPRETPAALVQMFVYRCNLSLDALAAELRLPVHLLRRWAEHGAPGWLRFALAGVAMQRGVPPTALTWLLDDTEIPVARRSDDHTPHPAGPADLGPGAERTTDPRPRRVPGCDPRSVDASG